MSSLITRVIDTIKPDVGKEFDLLKQGEESLVDTLVQTRKTVAYGITLAEGYAAHTGSDLLPPAISTLVNRSGLLFAGAAEAFAALKRYDKTPDTVYDGVYVGAKGQTFPPTTPLNKIPAVLPRDGIASNETLIYINGINTSKGSQAGSLQAIADRTGARVIGIHNATEGMITDQGQCITDKLDKGLNPAVDTLADTVYDEINAGRTVHVMAHSQGGLIASRALEHVYQRLRIEDGLSEAAAKKKLGLVKVETFGAAAGHYPDGPQYVHYINRDDPVPSLFGLGWDIDRYNPMLNAGRGAVVHWFTDLHLNPLASHSFEAVYLPQRVSFEHARRGDFDR